MLYPPLWIRQRHVKKACVAENVDWEQLHHQIIILCRHYLMVTGEAAGAVANIDRRMISFEFLSFCSSLSALMLEGIQKGICETRLSVIIPPYFNCCFEMQHERK